MANQPSTTRFKVTHVLPFKMIAAHMAIWHEFDCKPEKFPILIAIAVGDRSIAFNMAVTGVVSTEDSTKTMKVTVELKACSGGTLAIIPFPDDPPYDMREIDTLILGKTCYLHLANPKDPDDANWLTVEA